MYKNCIAIRLNIWNIVFILLQNDDISTALLSFYHMFVCATKVCTLAWPGGLLISVLMFVLPKCEH